MPFPTSTPYRFCTNLANRVALTASRKVSGWIGGTPVPAGQNNELQGIFSDWIAWIADGVSESMTVPLGLLTYQQRGLGGETATLDYTVTADPADSTVKITNNNDGSGISYSSALVRLKRGKLTGASVVVTASSGGGDATLYVYNGDGSLRSSFTGSMASPGTVALTGATIELDYESYGVIELITGDGGAGQTVTVRELTTTWGAP